MAESNQGGRRRILTAAAVGLLVLFAVYLIANIALRPDRYQWDFRVYYYAARGYPVGVDPYNPQEIQKFAPSCPLLPFVYPPPILTAFRLLAELPYDVAYYVWLGLKVLALIGLIFIWRRYLFRDAAPLPMVLILLLGFSGTIYMDLMTGNISILEQFLLWSGIVLLLRGRLLAFSALVILAASFKLTPAVFLLLLVFSPSPRRWRFLVGSVAASVGLLALSYFADPSLFMRFVDAAWRIDERGTDGNPSLLALIRDLGEQVFPASAMPWAQPGLFLLYGAAVIAILWVSIRSWRRLRTVSAGDADLATLHLFCVTYALVMPRFKTYSFIMLLPAAFYALKRNAHLAAFPFLLALFALLLHPPLPTRPPTQLLVEVLWLYHPLLLAFLLWGLLLHSVSRSHAAYLTAQTVGGGDVSGARGS
ncbi:MAG: glycosyltransferase family 87 protein [Candidatus Zixiibacteriota bacterium]